MTVSSSREDRLLDGLNPEQRAAAAHVDGPLLILAGAGSGKTRVITHRIAHLLARGHAPPEGILAVTFTNKAANEMKQRVAQLAGAKLVADMQVSTFHSFCLKVLREHIHHLGYRKDFNISSQSDTRTVMRRILADLEDSTKDSFKPETFLESIASLKNGLQSPAEALEPSPNGNGQASTQGEDSSKPEPQGTSRTSEKYALWLPEVYERYQSALRAANTVDFDDLLALSLQLWREHPKLLARMQKRYRYVLVDEFQDTNRLQYELVRTLTAKHGNVCVVGDDDQSIYSWRGADPRNIREFERDFPGAKVVKLERNYRSTQTILAAANAIIARNTLRREKKLWTEGKKGRPIDWIVVADDEHEAKMAASWIRLIQSKTGAAWRDFAVLYRSNTQSRAFEITLRQQGIPYAVYGGQDFFERGEVKDIIAYLKVLANPKDETALMRIINTPRRGIGDKTLHRVHDRCRIEGVAFLTGLRHSLDEGLLSGEAASGAESLLSLLREFRGRFKKQAQSITELTEELIERIGYREELRRMCKSPEQVEVRWNNVEAVVAAVRSFEEQAASPTLRTFLDQSSLSKEEDRPGRVERRENAVSLMTIHSAKGLEFDFVLLAGAEEGTMPHEKSLKEQALEEERRLFYVAVTRAKRHLTIFEALARVRHGRERMAKPSRFLAEIPEDRIQRHVVAAQEMVEDRVQPDAKAGKGANSNGTNGKKTAKNNGSKATKRR